MSSLCATSHQHEGSGSPCVHRALHSPAAPQGCHRMAFPDFSASVVTHVFLQFPSQTLHRRFLADTGAHLTASFLTLSTKCSGVGSEPAPLFTGSSALGKGPLDVSNAWRDSQTTVPAATSHASVREGSKDGQSFVSSHKSCCCHLTHQHHL